METSSVVAQSTDGNDAAVNVSWPPFKLPCRIREAFTPAC